MTEEPIPVSHGVFKIQGNIYTLNLVPGKSVYGEELFLYKDVEYRRWDPRRSKLGAFLIKEKDLPFRYDSVVLYLGAGDGTTVSHLSDILTHGKVFAVEVAKKPYRNLLELSKKRKNIFPVLADARNPENYKDIIGKVDVIYQDIAQRDQVEIFLKNLFLLEEERFALIAVKARSMDVSSPPKEMYRKVEKRLEERHEVISCVDISPWQKDHAIVVIKR